MRPRQVQVLYSRALVLDDLAAVGPEDSALWPKDRDNEAAVQVLVAALAVNAQLLQPLADRGSRLPVLVREAQAEGPVGEAKPEGFYRLLAPDPAFFGSSRFVVGKWLKG